MSVRRRILPPGWYPASADECSAEIRRFLAGFAPPEGHWRGGIAPHASWYFSGKAAARVMCAIAGSFQPDRVVVYGGHLSFGNRPVVYTEDSWETPFGLLPMDTLFARELVDSGEAIAARGSFADNTVEVQLPFVLNFFPKSPMIALHSPASDAATRLGAAVSDLLAGKGLSAVFIGSADLTHYGPNYGFAPTGVGETAVKWVKEENDRSLIDKALAMDAQGLLEDAEMKHNTCSAGPFASVMASVAQHGVLSGTLLDYYTSYDIMPDPSFVGYAAILY